MTIDLYYLFASSVAALIARLFTHPIDTIKTRIQTSTQTTTIKNILFTSSFLSLYDGLTVTLWFVVPALSIYLSTYQTTKQYLSISLGWNINSPWTHLVSGCMAEVLAGIFFTPMEVIKSRLQVQRSKPYYQTLVYDTNETNDPINDNYNQLPYSETMNDNYDKGTLSLMQTIYVQDGWQGFYKGYGITLVVFVPQTMIYFMVYEQLKLHLVSGLSTYLFCSVMASTISVAFCNPLDVIKTRWQVDHQYNHQQSFIEIGAIILQMYRTEGYGAFMKGTLARVIWGVPMTTISMCIFEVLKDWHSS
ncbi:mitochondrial carrier domain-containing protein [Halteromyces radiatus]|uniref:mitochondrial carrier domain-containing protein n=1 Tax=Halteromyces radiatus TaxID=101107 RepID=UPI00221FF7B5|nr:mitochondrial carrier domain-containing protein [Halteromyces radiatus]KAI8089860.1 mitochondrial carrier domain-containing protein [Halteromyces radiatus]